LFFGFFITMGTAVNAMGAVEVINRGATLASISIFPVLGVLAYAGFFYMIKNKFPRFRDRRVC